MTSYDLLTLHNEAAVNRASEFAEVAGRLDVAALVAAYRALVRDAPSRRDHGKDYLMENRGIPGSGKASGRSEEHLAAALYNAATAGKPLHLLDGRALRVIHYQTPLKARRSDARVGKVDLLALLDDARLCVIELKVAGVDRRLGDTPLRAFLEGLAYCAIVEANAAAIASEVECRHRVRLAPAHPALAVLAPEDYWRGFDEHRATGPWRSNLRCLIGSIEGTLGIEAHLLVLRHCGFEMGRNGQSPYLTSDCEIVALEQVQTGAGR